MSKKLRHTRAEVGTSMDTEETDVSESDAVEQEAIGHSATERDTRKEGAAGRNTMGQARVTEGSAPPAEEEAHERVEAALKAAEQARREGRLNEGMNLLMDALEYNVRADSVFYRLGNLYYDAKDLGRAEYVYQRAIQVNPRHVNAHYNLAVIYKKTGRIHDSVRIRKRAVRLEATGKAGRYLVRDEPPEFAKPRSDRAGGPGGLRAHLKSLGTGRGNNVAGQKRKQHGSGNQNQGQGGNSAAASGVYHDPKSTVNTGPSGPMSHPNANLSGRDVQSSDANLPPGIDDPAAFRRWGRRLALQGFIFLVGIGVVYLAAIFFLGRYLF